MSGLGLCQHCRRFGWAALLALSAVVAQACDTPVYQYTLENWERDPYQVFYFHQGGPAPEDARANDYLRQVAAGQIEHANLSFISVDVSAPGGPRSPAQRRIWEECGARQPPLHAIYSPKGQQLFVGRLSEADARALVSSPARTRLALELARGTHGALLLVTGTNPEENAAARAALRQVVAASISAGREVAALEVARDDPAEVWLLRQLLLLQPDLKDLANAMVFPIFGRGHALEPYLGKGITERNLSEVVAFMNGPCACEIKSASIGTDLLTNFDWSAARLPAAAQSAPGFVLVDVAPAPAAEPTCVMPTAPGAARLSSSGPADPARRPTRPRSPAAPTSPPTASPAAPASAATPAAPPASGAQPAAPTGPPAPHRSPPAAAAAEAAAPSVASAGLASAPAAAPASAPGSAAALPPPTTAASDERARNSGPDLVAASRPAPADLQTLEGAPPLAARLPLALGLGIAAAALVVLLLGTFLVLRPARARAGGGP